MRNTRVFIIEDNRILREGISALLKKQEDLKVVAATAGNHDTILKLRDLKPDLVLLDLGLRSENGLRIVETIAKELPNIRVVGMGLIPTQLDIVELVQAGAAGFILKDASIAEVLGTIRSVARGMKILPPLLTGSLFSLIVDHAIRGGKKKLAAAVRMTKREREIVVLIAQAMSNKDIARHLNISTYTVKSHVHNILEKMALHSRLEIATHSYENQEP